MMRLVPRHIHLLLAKKIDRLADEVYKIAKGICRTADDGVPPPRLTSYLSGDDNVEDGV